MGFNALVGGRPKYQDGRKIENMAEELVTNPKWDGCKHRSETEVPYFVQTCSCGSGENRSGFKCLRLEINGLKPQICDKCELFESKEVKLDEK